MGGIPGLLVLECIGKLAKQEPIRETVSSIPVCFFVCLFACLLFLCVCVCVSLSALHEYRIPRSRQGHQIL